MYYISAGGGQGPCEGPVLFLVRVGVGVGTSGGTARGGGRVVPVSVQLWELRSEPG